jgi:hypothetical protein
MSGYAVSPKADEDILIWRYLYEGASIEVDNRVEAEIYDALETEINGQKIPETRFLVLFNDGTSAEIWRLPKKIEHRSLWSRLGIGVNRLQQRTEPRPKGAVQNRLK